MRKPITILYVDDDLSSLLSLKEELMIDDITVLTENNGKSGLVTYDDLKDDIDMVIIDVHMNNINGYDLLITIRKEDPKIPIIMVSSNKLIQNKEDVKKMGANEYLTKPFDKDLLHSVIKKLIK